MNTESINVSALQPFTPEPQVYYPIEVAARLAQMPRHRILVCCRRRIVAPWIDQESGRYLFDADTIRVLQRVEYLHAECGVNFTGIQIILALVDEVERFRADNSERPPS